MDSPRTPSRWKIWFGTSLVVFALSERAFWAFWRKGDHATDLLITWFAYSLVVAFCLSIARISKVRNFDQVFLVGALLGWITEGVIVQTALGGADNPFPLSISWTGLAWHSLLTVIGGCWVLPHWASEPRNPRNLAKLAAAGLGYGLWANYYFVEKGESVLTLASFSTHTLFIAAMLVPGLWLMGNPFPIGPAERRDKVIIGGVGTIAAGLYVAVALIPLPLHAVVLAACFGVTLWALLRQRNAFEEPATPGPSVSFVGAMVAGGLPLVVAWIVVALTFQTGHWGLPTNVVLYVITMPVGFWLLFRGWWRAFRSSKLGS